MGHGGGIGLDRKVIGWLWGWLWGFIPGLLLGLFIGWIYL